MAEEISLLPLMLFFLILNCGNGIQCFQEKKAFNLQKFQWRELVHLSSCHPQISRTEKAATVLEMKHKDYCSGLIRDWDKELQNRLIADGIQEVNIPAVKMHYEGDVEMNVDVSGIFYFVKTDASQVCLALASLSDEDELGIIGNYQQKNLRVIYDSKESRIGFAEETCSFIKE
ncbi:hypothetical protein NE237_025269 [Protea cynaroides]|uniref:Xylanase inhibitor C-terminal domain-containing protein n=1 Tax=Protea cynaroides TaxID=273540 RepID=A0A9Q0K1L2_9MAGN|nr:hypothetical protein NE237_025269 [Protea cynaroides]